MTITVSGMQVLEDGVPIRLFGVNETMALVYAYWGGTDLGRNYNFPTFDGRISGVTTVDEFWREYMRYFLHYQQTGVPRPNLLRLTVAWDFEAEESYYAWRDAPDQYFEVLDRLIYWARRAGVYLCPSMMHQPNNRPHIGEYYDRSSSRYAHLVEYERAILERYDAEPQIAMWDLFNEPDMGPSGYWDAHGGFWNGYRPWVQALIRDVRGSARNHPITFGHAMTSSGANFADDPGGGFSQEWWNAFNDVEGLDVGQIHWYSTAEDQYLIDWQRDWALALGKPVFAGEVGYNAYPSPVGAPYPIGYWPWFTNGWLSAGIGPAAAMTFLDNGKGPYADYPYKGLLPEYPAETQPPPTPVPAPELEALKTRVTALETSLAALQEKLGTHTHAITIPSHTIPRRELKTAVPL